MLFTFKKYFRRKFLSSLFATQERRKFQRRRRDIFVVHQLKNNKLRQERHILMSLLTELKYILIGFLQICRAYVADDNFIRNLRFFPPSFHFGATSVQQFFLHDILHLPRVKFYHACRQHGY
jgi:hypothetical protein